MQLHWGVCVSMLLVPASILAQDRPAQTRNQATAPAIVAADSLPVKRVVLYKSGVGYFEHLGTVQRQPGRQRSVHVGPAQRRSEVAHGAGSERRPDRRRRLRFGRAGGPAARRSCACRSSEKATLTDFLAALRGARLEVRSGTNTITGRLLSIERKTRIGGGTTLEVDYISLLTDKGELKTTELSPAFSVRLLDAGLPGKMDRFLDVVSAGREADVRRMVISTAGAGERSLFVSYISEVPVWKTTYRIVLRPKANAAAARLGDRRQHGGRGLGPCAVVAGGGSAALVHPESVATILFAAAGGACFRTAVEVAPQTYEATLVAGAGARGRSGARPVGRSGRRTQA